MNVEFDKSFERSIVALKDNTIPPRIAKWILKLEEAKSLNKLSGVKKLTGYKIYYRIRIGEYRLGFEKINDTDIRLIIVAHRKEIYRLFPR